MLTGSRKCRKIIDFMALLYFLEIFKWFRFLGSCSPDRKRFASQPLSETGPVFCPPVQGLDLENSSRLIRISIEIVRTRRHLAEQIKRALVPKITEGRSQSLNSNKYFRELNSQWRLARRLRLPVSGQIKPCREGTAAPVHWLL